MSDLEHWRGKVSLLRREGRQRGGSYVRSDGFADTCNIKTWGARTAVQILEGPAQELVIRPAGREEVLWCWEM